jgi:hypothetical protein
MERFFFIVATVSLGALLGIRFLVWLLSGAVIPWGGDDGEDYESQHY